MNNDVGTKLFMEAFYKYIEENDIEVTDDNINDLLHTFMEIYNEDRRLILSGKKKKSDEEKIADLLEEATTSGDTKRAKQLVKRALKINPDHISAQLVWLDLLDDPIAQLEKLKELQAKEKQRIAYFEKETGQTIDNYYLDLEGRDYLHILFDLCQTYLKCGMYRRALEVAIEGVQLDPMDHPVFHNDVIALLLHLEDYEEVEQWLKGYQIRTPACLLFESIFSYKQEDLVSAQNKIEELCETAPNARKILLQEKISDRAIEKMMFDDSGVDLQEFMDIIRSYPFLFSENAYFDWMLKIMKKYKKVLAFL